MNHRLHQERNCIYKTQPGFEWVVRHFAFHELLSMSCLLYVGNEADSFSVLALVRLR